MKRTAAAIKEYRFVLLSFFLSGALFIALLVKTGIFPFGNLTLLMSDMNSIYAEFLAEYQRMLQGQGNPFYTFNAGIGLNLLGIIVFYLPSPLNFILGALPQKYLVDGITLITTLKIALSALTFTFFLKKRHAAHADSLLLTTFGVLYAFIGYSISYLFNMIWLDGVIMLPLIFFAIDLLVDEDRWLPAVFLYGLLFLSNFYIGYMVGVFSTFYLFARLFSHGQIKWPAIFRKLCLFALSVLLAAGLNAIPLVPMGSLLKNNMGLFGQTAPSFEIRFPLFDLFLKFFPGTFDGYKDSLPHVYCGLISLLAVPLYFSNRLIANREKAGALATLLIMMISFTLAPLDFFWHAFDHPSWFPFRYAFLVSFYCLFLAYRGLVHSEGISAKWTAGSGALATVYLVFIQKFDAGRLSNQVFYLNLCLILIYCLILIILRQKPHWAALTLLVLCSIEVFLNSDQILQQYRSQYVSRADYTSFHERHQTRLKSVLPPAGSFYRVEKTEIRTYNDPMGLGYPGMANFSSIADLSQSRFLKKLGFDCYATWCTYSGGTIFSDSLLGIRYILSDGSLNFYQPVAEGIFENPYAFPPAFFIESAFASFPDMEADDPIALQNELLNKITGAQQPWFEAVPITLNHLSNLTLANLDNGQDLYIRNDPEEPAAVTYQLKISDDQPHILFIPNVSLNFNIWINDKQVFDQNQNYTPYLVRLDEYRAGDIVKVRVDLGKSQEYRDEIRLYTFDLERFQTAAEALQATAPTSFFDGNRRFTFSFSPAVQDRNLLTSIPYDQGWEAQIDGKTVQPSAVMGSLIGLQMPAGSQTVSLTFLPNGFKLGAELSGLTVFVLLLLILLERRKTKREADRV
jgi:uncharacterized membrane protein YfhO